MRRGLVAAGVAALVLAPAAGARAQSVPISAGTSFTPLVHAFGDPVTATVSVSADARLVDPASIRTRASFAPYRGRLLRVERSSAGDGVVLVRFVYRLRCTTAACLPHLAERVFELPAAEIRWRTPAGAPGRTFVGWPRLLEASRLTRLDVQSPSFLASAEPPAPSYALPPLPFAAALFSAGGLLLAAGAAVLVRRLLRLRRRAAAVEPLRRALALVEEASRAGVVERRRALYRLALVLEEARLEPESWAARKLAWAPATPDPDGMQLLSLVIREQLQEAM